MCALQSIPLVRVVSADRQERTAGSQTAIMFEILLVSNNTLIDGIVYTFRFQC